MCQYSDILSEQRGQCKGGVELGKAYQRGSVEAVAMRGKGLSRQRRMGGWRSQNDKKEGWNDIMQREWPWRTSGAREEFVLRANSEGESAPDHDKASISMTGDHRDRAQSQAGEWDVRHTSDLRVAWPDAKAHAVADARGWMVNCKKKLVYDIGSMYI